jgi:hypothetical protein
VRSIGIAVSSLLALWGVWDFVLPACVPADAWRPRLERALSEAGAPIRFGALRLRTGWGIGLIASSVRATDPTRRLEVTAKRVEARLSAASLLWLAPVVDIRMDEVSVRGAVPSPATAPATALRGTGTGEGTAAGSARWVEMLRRARLGIAVHGLDIRANGLPAIRLAGLEASARGFLGPVAQVEARATGDWASGPGRAHGPLRLRAEWRGALAQGLPSGPVRVSIDGQGVTARLGYGAEKRAGVPAYAQGTLRFAQGAWQVADLVARLHRAVFSGAIRGGGAGEGIQASLHSEPIPLASLPELVPALDEAELGGSVTLDAHASGPLRSPRWQIGIGLHGVTGRSRDLAIDPVADGRIVIGERGIDSLALSIGAGGDTIEVSGSARLRSAVFAIRAAHLDLDRLLNAYRIDLPPLGAATLELRGNPFLAGTRARFSVAIGELRLHGATWRGVGGDILWREGKLSGEGIHASLLGDSLLLRGTAQVLHRSSTSTPLR